MGTKPEFADTPTHQPSASEDLSGQGSEGVIGRRVKLPIVPASGLIVDLAEFDLDDLLA